MRYARNLWLKSPYPYGEFFRVTFAQALSIKRLLQESVADGIVCTDDLTALLVLQAAKELAIKVPEQLKVTGFDGTTQIQLYHPELSTIVQPISDIAELLVEVLKARIKQPTEPLKQMQYKLPVTFLQRNSTSRSN